MRWVGLLGGGLCVCFGECVGRREGMRGGGQVCIREREIRQVRGSGGGRAREAGCEGGNGMCVCVCAGARE